MKEYVIHNMSCPISYFIELDLYIDNEYVSIKYQEYIPSRISDIDTPDKMFYIT